MFRFSPIGSETFLHEIPMAVRASLPESVVVKTRNGAIFTRSDGIVVILDRLGGIWRFFGWGLRLFPRSFRDGGYRAVARARYLFFGPPADVCPLMTQEERRRFDW